MDGYDFLVTILSIALFIFLLLAIIGLIYLLRILKRVHEIAEVARTAADNVEMAAKIFSKSAGPAVVTRIIANVVETFKDHKKKEQK